MDLFTDGSGIDRSIIWDGLPNEILGKILSFLNLEDLLIASGVCKRWCDVINKWVIKNRAILRWRGQWLPEKYLSLHVTIPLSRRELTDYCNKDVEELELRIMEIGWGCWSGLSLDNQDVDFDLSFFHDSLRRLTLTSSYDFKGKRNSKNEKSLNNFLPIGRVLTAPLPNSFESLRVIIHKGKDDERGEENNELNDLIWDVREVFTDLVLVQGDDCRMYRNCEEENILQSSRLSVDPSTGLKKLRMEGWTEWILQSPPSLLSRLIELELVDSTKNLDSSSFASISRLPLLKRLSLSNVVASRDWSETLSKGFPCLDQLLFLDSSHLHPDLVQASLRKPLSYLLLDLLGVEDPSGILSSWETLRVNRLELFIPSLSVFSSPSPPPLSSLMDSLISSSVGSSLRSLFIRHYPMLDLNHSKEPFLSHKNQYLKKIREFCSEKGIDFKWDVLMTRLLTTTGC